MFKSIPGNNEYVISLTQDIRCLDGTKSNLCVRDNKVDIVLYGVLKRVDLSWLSLIAHFECTLPYSNVKDLLNVSFSETNIRFIRQACGKIMTFRKPIVLSINNKVYRVIPCFTRYAISCDGDIIELSSGETINKSKDLRRHNLLEPYPTVYIYNPERCSYKYLMVHRLVALAWINNPGNDFVLRPIVNHKDGNKKNYYFKNLEWCSHYENNIHAINTGLRGDNNPCKVRDFKTGLVREFASISQASAFMGLKSRAYTISKLYDVKARLINNRYEVKLASDSSPWFYENKTEKVKIGRYVITVRDPAGNIEYFNDLRDFKDKFKISNCPKVSDILNKARFENNGYSFEVEDNYHSENIQAFNTQTKVITETKTITEMSRKFNIPEHTIRNCLNDLETTVRQGYAFRYKTMSTWNTDFVQLEKINIRLLAINQLTKEEIKFDSIRAAAKGLHADRTAIKNSYINDILLREWKIVKLVE